MEFKDGKKLYSIEFEEIHNRFNGTVQAGFVLDVSKPFTAKSRFTENDIKTLRGVKGINFYKSSEIAEAVGAKEDVLFSLTDNALNYIESEGKKGMESIKAQAKQKTVQSWVWAIGGDTHNLYVSTDDLDSLEMQFRDDLKVIRNYIETNDRRVMKFLREHSKNIERHTALYTAGGWNQISNINLMEIYHIIKTEDTEKQATKDKKRQAIFDRAAETGERQILKQWSEECCDPSEDCDIDNLVKYAMPDGSTEVERYHTW